MSIFTRLLRRPSAPPVAPPSPPVDAALEARVDVALGLAGHELDADGLGPLLAAVGEEPVVAASVQPCRGP